jgi:hypothetical protein
MIHDLKIFPQYFEAVESGRKTFEIRKDDRPYKVGDILILREWSTSTNSYTGNRTERKITYALRGAPGIQEGYVILGLHWFISERSH